MGQQDELHTYASVGVGTDEVARLRGLADTTRERAERLEVVARWLGAIDRECAAHERATKGNRK